MESDDLIRYMLARPSPWSTGSHISFPGHEITFSGPTHADPHHEETEPAAKKQRSEPKAVSWDDIGGQEEAKRQMMEAIELPFTHKDIFAHYGINPPKGILLYGPPGCGKTMFGKAAASAIAKIHNRPISDGAFVYVKAPEIQDKFVGESERKVRKLFEDAKKYKSKHGYPAVIFIDEADAILPNRSRSTRYESSVVASFLTEMDGMEDSGAIVILATNRPDSIDPAIVRDGRIDRKIRIGRPDPVACQTILRMNLNAIPVRGITHKNLANVMVREFFAEYRVIFRLHTDKGVHEILLAHLINGAMLAGAVNQAASLALHRDLATKKQSGLRKQDVINAIDGIQRQQLDLDHSDAANELLEALGGKLLRVERVAFRREERVVSAARAGSKNIFEDAA